MGFGRDEDLIHTSLLVTGGAGFIGGCFVRRSLGEANSGLTKLVNLDKLTYAGNLDSLEPIQDDPRYRFVQGDIADRALVGSLLREHAPSAVINFAAETHVNRSIEGPRAFLQTNVVGTFELLCRRARLLADPGRARALRLPVPPRLHRRGLWLPRPRGKFTETTPYSPHSPYSASKAASDHFVRAFHDTYGLPVLVTNCSNNYGPFQFPEKLIPVMVLNTLEGKPLPVYGDGKNIRDWLYVEDHARALALVLDKGTAGRDLQYRWGLRADEPASRRGDLPDGRCASARPAAPALQVVADVRGRSSRPRPPVCDRHVEDSPRAGLDARGRLRVGADPDRGVVSPEPHLVGPRGFGKLPARADRVECRGGHVVTMGGWLPADRKGSVVG